MRHLIFTNTEQQSYRFALLIRDTGLKKEKIVKHYIAEMEDNGIDRKNLVAFTANYDKPKTATAKFAKEYMNDLLLPALRQLGTKYILCADPNYFKYLTGVKKTEPYHGYVLPSKLKGWEDEFNVVLVPNHGAVFHNPDIQDKIDLDIKKMCDHASGVYEELGKDIIVGKEYHSTLTDVEAFLNRLHQYPELTVDIEAFSLKHYDAGLGTVGFAWDKNHGGVVSVDKHLNNAPMRKSLQPYCQYRALLRKFFTEYKGKCIYHNATYDVKGLIYNLWMEDLLDQKGMLEGLEIMTRNFGDTKIITYLATNSTGGNKLGLKDQSHEYTGNYAQEDINDISLIPWDELVEYNLVDCLATWYVHEKHWQTVIDDEQEDVYNNIMLPSLKVIIQMELTGMCLDMERVKQAVRKVDRNLRWFTEIVKAHPAVDQTIKFKKTEQILKDNQKLKTKKREWHELDHIDFNPNSDKDLQILLHEVLKYPVIETTDGGAPSCGAKVIAKHIKMHARDRAEKNILKALIGISDASIIRNNFLANFLKAERAPDGFHYLFGSFNLGGTVSGRLSSSNPNMQNIPSSGTPYAKMIKRCFIAPTGWIFCGADFASLEDRISALTTRDPMKLKVYTDGYDGHCLRAYNYFPEEYIGIPETPETINATKSTHKKWRQLSKTPTFALTYGGTFKAIMGQTGMSEPEAKKIEENYHKMYSVSDQWVQDHIMEASKTGYVTIAFGLRLRTPVLAKCVMNTSITPREAQGEARTAGNALGQSWGLLNNRAAIELQEKVLNSKYALDIRPCAHIHDAQYFYVRDDVDAVKFLNDNLGEAMSWQDDPLIMHDEVKLSGELDLFYPSWAYDGTLPNYASKEKILEVADSLMGN